MPDKLRILVVDDNEKFCHSVADVLELNNYEVVIAEDGFKALEMTKHNGFDLVLMDSKMPLMDGLETFKKVKEISPGTPVIMVTAYAVEDIIRDALREGAFGALKKPLDVIELFGLIEQATAVNGAMILVADDDENLCATIEDVLSNKGYRVNVAYDGNMAVEKAWKNNYDIMLIDLKMPALNGLETYLAIRDFRPNAVVVIISGYLHEMNELVQQALRESAYTCLEKPIDMDKLVALLAWIMEQKAKGKPKKSG
jgi:two-component system response regulator HydG